MEMLDEAMRLSRMLGRERKFLEKYDLYFEGEQPLRFIAPQLQQELGHRLSPIVLNLAQFAVDVYDNRLDIEGFRSSSDEISDDELMEIWEINDGALTSQQVHREGLALGRGYVTVGPGDDDDDAPVVTIESAFDAIHEDDPRTKKVKHGIKKWTDTDKTRWMTYHHLNGWASWYWKSGEWAFDKEETTDYKLCGLVPLMNDPRLLGRSRPGKFDQRIGRPVFHPIVSELDALNKFAWDMMVSGEFHALPRRWGTGLSEDDFVDEATGKAMGTWSMIAGRMWGTENEKAKFGQFTEADLANFHNTIKLLMQITAMQLGLPSHYLLFQGDNPPSADAIRSSESQLVKRAERMQQSRSTRWEQVQRLVMLRTGRGAEAAKNRIETLWRDPSTPTIAQKADAIVKLVQARDSQGRSIVPIEQAREDLGYSTIQQSQMRDWDQAALVDPQIEAARRELQDAAGGQ
ncbi:MAG: phage portal protein [Microbacterium sp.]|nr:MAG: phage portal protein [Microbacterium sp.]